MLNIAVAVCLALTLMVVNMVVLFTKHIKVMLVNMGIQR